MIKDEEKSPFRISLVIYKLCFPYTLRIRPKVYSPAGALLNKCIFSLVAGFNLVLLEK